MGYLRCCAAGYVEKENLPGAIDSARKRDVFPIGDRLIAVVIAFGYKNLIAVEYIVHLPCAIYRLLAHGQSIGCHMLGNSCLLRQHLRESGIYQSEHKPRYQKRHRPPHK